MRLIGIFLFYSAIIFGLSYYTYTYTEDTTLCKEIKRDFNLRELIQQEDLLCVENSCIESNGNIYIKKYNIDLRKQENVQILTTLNTAQCVKDYYSVKYLELQMRREFKEYLDNKKELW